MWMLTERRLFWEGMNSFVDVARFPERISGM